MTDREIIELVRGIYARMDAQDALIKVLIELVAALIEREKAREIVANGV